MKNLSRFQLAYLLQSVQAMMEDSHYPDGRQLETLKVENLIKDEIRARGFKVDKFMNESKEQLEEGRIYS